MMKKWKDVLTIIVGVIAVVSVILNVMTFFSSPNTEIRILKNKMLEYDKKMITFVEGVEERMKEFDVELVKGREERAEIKGDLLVLKTEYKNLTKTIDRYDKTLSSISGNIDWLFQNK